MTVTFLLCKKCQHDRLCELSVQIRTGEGTSEKPSHNVWLPQRLSSTWLETGGEEIADFPITAGNTDQREFFAIRRATSDAAMVFQMQICHTVPATTQDDWTRHPLPNPQRPTPSWPHADAIYRPNSTHIPVSQSTSSRSSAFPADLEVLAEHVDGFFCLFRRDI